MGKGSSSSESTQSTATTTTDARIVADNAATVLQSGASQNISFSPEVAQATGIIVNSIMDFSNGVVSSAADVLKTSLAANEKQAAAVLDFGKTALASSPSTPTSASSGILSNQNNSTINPTLLIGIGAAIVAAFVLLKKRG